MSGVGYHQPYRTSAEKIEDAEGSDRIKHYKQDHETIEVKFSFAPNTFPNKMITFSPIPPTEFTEDYNAPWVKESIDQLNQLLHNAFKYGFLELGNVYIPWHSFIGAEIVKRVKTMVEFKWIKKDPPNDRSDW